jgi:hypothetical protein
MYIRRVINQYHCDKIKEYPHVDHQIKKKILLSIH